MASGDWHPESGIALEIVNIQFHDDPAHPELLGQISHVGVGYHVRLPSGQIGASKGHTWGGPGGLPPPQRLRWLQNAMDDLLQEVLEQEGLAQLTHKAGPHPPQPAAEET